MQLPIFAVEKETERRERRRSLLLLSTMMSTGNYIETIKELLHPLLTDDIFLVDIRIKPTNNVKIFLDADTGLSIDKCIKINRALYKLIEEGNVFTAGDFSLEISSPGIDEPLKLHRQYVKNIGRDVEVTFKDNTKKAGKLIAADENEIVIEFTEGKNKKAVQKTLNIALSDIKETVVQIKF